jgi:membrane protein implicated in regulation of membrane protease activity
VHATHSAHHGTTEKEAAGEWQNVNVANTLAIHLNGPRHAPLAMVAEAFLLLWGICGLSLSRAMVSDPSPTAGRMLPVLVLALAAGLVGAKIAAMLIARILPADETLVVSRDALFGMTGEVAFQVTEGAGRIHVYDQFGTLHDESCRVAAAYPPIERGRSAMVVDRDARGSLIVEEVPASHG